MTDQPIRFRPLWGRVLAVVVVLVCAAGAVGYVVAGDPAGFWATLPFLALVAVLAWALFWRPELIVEPHRVRIVNVFRTIDLAWPGIQRIDTRFSLTLFTGAGRFAVWAAPAPGLRGATRVERGDVSGLPGSTRGEGGSVRPGDALGTPSGDAGFLVRRRWEELRDAGMLDRGPEPGSVRVRVHTATVAVLVALAAACAVSAALQAAGR